MTRRRGQAPVLNSLGRRSRSERLRPTANWWETFFTGLIVDFWRAAMPPEATRAEADFFEKSLEARPGARLLDVPCGDARLALELAGRGHLGGFS